MKALILSRQGEEILEELRVNPTKTLTFRKIVFSNLSQPDDVPLSGNRMYGTTCEGFILLSYKMLFSNFPTVVFIGYIDRGFYPTPDYIPRSFGLYDDSDILVCYGNVNPVDPEISVIVKAGLVLIDHPLTSLSKISVNSYLDFDFNEYVRRKLRSRSSAPTSTVNTPVYHFTIDNDLKVVSHGVKVLLGDGNTYKLVLNEDYFVIEGEYVAD